MISQRDAPKLPRNVCNTGGDGRAVTKSSSPVYGRREGPIFGFVSSASCVSYVGNTDIDRESCDTDAEMMSIVMVMVVGRCWVGGVKGVW